MKTKNTINFLSDNPSLVKKVQFGHGEIITTLYSIIEQTNTPHNFTIGLIGKYGSGKSLIISKLKEKIVAQKNTTGIVVFDVWKHEGDSLRRTFLKESCKQLKKGSWIKDEFHLNKNHDSSIRNDIIKGLKFNHYLSNDLIGLLLTFLIFLGLHQVLGYFFTIPISIDFIFKSILPFLLGLIVPIILGKLIYIQNIKITKDKFLDPHEFESEFKNMLSQKQSIEKLVIVFDNLDRVSPKKALEVIRAVKTFLEPEEIEGLKLTYLIPCDLKSIQTFVKGETNSDNAIEFLKKFFNLTISIPKFHKQDLEEYTRDLLSQTKHPHLLNNTKVAWLISEGFQENPRQILQFINTLLSYILLIENSTDIKINTNYLKDNINCFTKFLILKYEYPEIFKNLIEEGKKVERIESPFLKNTVEVKTDSFELLQYLRLSKFETDFPKVQDFINLVSSNDTTGLQKFIDSENLKDQKFEDLFNHIITRNKLQNAPDSQRIIFLDCILDLIQKNKFKPTDQLFNNFQKQFMKTGQLHKIKVSNIEFLIQNITTPDNQNNVLGKLISELNYLKPDLSIQEKSDYFIPYVEELLEFIFQSKFIIFKHDNDNPKNLIARNFVGKLNFDLIFGDDLRKIFFLSEEYARNLIEQLKIEHLDKQNKIRRELLNLNNHTLQHSNIELLGNKIEGFVKNDLNYKSKVVPFLNDFLINFFKKKEHNKFSALKLKALNPQVKFDPDEDSKSNKEIAIFFILNYYISHSNVDDKTIHQPMHPKKVLSEADKFGDFEYSRLLEFKLNNENFSIEKSYKNLHVYMLQKAENDKEFKEKYNLLLE